MEKTAGLDVGEVDPDLEPPRMPLETPAQGDLGLFSRYIEDERDVALDAVGVAAKAEHGRRSMPRSLEKTVLERERGVEHVEDGQIAEGPSGPGGLQQLVEQARHGRPRCAGALRHLHVEVPPPVPVQADARAEELDALRRQHPLQERHGTEGDRRFRNGRDRRAVRADGAEVENADIEGPLPSGPGEDGVPGLDPHRAVLGLQRSHDVG